MKLSEILGEGLGRIVQGVNTTQDVQPGEIKRQAAKLGIDVDDDGHPPVMGRNPFGGEKEKRFKPAKKRVPQRKGIKD